MAWHHDAVSGYVASSLKMYRFLNLDGPIKICQTNKYLLATVRGQRGRLFFVAWLKFGCFKTYCDSGGAACVVVMVDPQRWRTHALQLPCNTEHQSLHHNTTCPADGLRPRPYSISEIFSCIPNEIFLMLPTQPLLSLHLFLLPFSSVGGQCEEHRHVGRCIGRSQSMNPEFQIGPWQFCQ